MDSFQLQEGAYRLIFESLPGLYLILLPDFRIAAVSDSYLQATKTKRDEILGRKIFDVFPDNPSDPDATGVRNLRDSLESVLKNKIPDAMAVQKYDVRRPESEGGGFEEKYWSPMNSPLFDDKGEIIFIIHRAEEVTEFVRLKQAGKEQDKAAEELRNLTSSMETEIYQRAQEIQTSNKKLLRLNEEAIQRENELKQVYQKLFDMDRIKTRFFTNLSHELRTPLTLILGPVRTLLKGENVDPSKRSLLETIERNAYTLLKHVNDLLDVSKLEAGKIKLEYSNVILSDLILSLAAHFDSVVEERGLEFRLEIEKDCKIQIDASKIERVLLNLFSNAFKFVPNGGKILCSLRTEGAYALLSVADNGPGVPPELRELIFEKFRQGEEGDARSHGGTGLGLAIVKEFVGLHKGSVWVAKSSLGGAEFTVKLPLQTSAAAELIRERKNDPKENDPALKAALHEAELIRKKADEETHVSFANRPKILIVEDNREMRAYISNTLSRDFNIVTAFDGQQGLEAAIREQPDVIVTDLMMPVLSGDRMVKEIRKVPRLANVPILFLSAKADQDLRIRLLEEGAQDYLIKPFASEELSAKVNNFIILRKLIESLEIANKDLEAFSYSVSHDLRAPIRGIEGFIQILLEDYGKTFEPEALRLLDVIRKSAALMNKLVQDLLHFHKYARLDPSNSVIDMELMARETAEAVMEEYPGKNFSIEVEPLPLAYGDRAAIKQVWVNLISNAVKYSSTKEDPRIRISCSTNDGYNTYTVRDNGVGFENKYSNRLFKVFQRLHVQEDFEGTGVGLAIVARIIQRHGGKVYAEGETDRGSSFFFSLPISAENVQNERSLS
ncbi:response regulator [Leptospira gomenensis]|uniref:histidine kinase n=1 Tax=Leptospira gomenensis TaxID=2484974 RepID=A0A5F1YF57_9LEPT|nr:ATP-binding protein [Leptospira gomenensis]TGK38448.1 response regulator [Leptospira gomenensis]TGK42563.1 response regulator [Leptospira gomenensis]TGK42804.1 response regulator [Leptospira gomenensis]TGK55811.1 response regulator [Leptospira gomenensis]